MAPAGCCCCCYCCWGGAVAAADAARRVLMLLLLGVLSVGPRPGALATEHYSPLSLLKQELQHRQQQEAQAGGGCSPQSGDWGDQYSVECGESSFLNFHDSDCEPKGPPPCDSLLSLNTEKILSQAKSIAEQKRFPFATDNDSTNEELAIAYVLIGSGLYDEAIRHFSTMLQEEPDLVSAIYGRGIAYGKKGLHDIKNAELALFELSRVITLEPDRPEVFEQRAEILSPLGRINEAVNDLTKAIQLQPSARLYRHRGTLYFISEDYATAHEDFQQSLELNKNQPIAMLYKGLTFFHRGLLKEAIESFKEALKQKVDFIDAYKSLGQAYRELGNFEAATESFQKALLLNQNHVQTLQLRGMMLYHHGSLQEALKNFKRCLQLEPYNEVCQYMKGLSHVAMGQFYEGIKAQTKVMLNDPLPGQKASPEYLKVKYLREYSRYLHAHLDTPLTEYNIDVDLPGSFKDHWAKNLPFLIEDYEEQPGLQPHIKDVLHQNFESYKPEVQELICVADRLGSLMQYETPGFLPNKRIHRAMGLAALEVMQAVQRTWTNSKVRMNGKTRLMQWRDMFDIAVKWRRIADPDQPVLWLDQMPARSLSRGFNNHINLIRGQVINMRYLEYFEKILHFIKDRILVYHGANNPKGLLEVREALEKVHKVEDLLPIMKFNTKTKDGFTVNTKVPSLKDQGKEYDGFTITITGDKVGNILFSVETQTTEERTQLYHAEIDALYKDLTAKGKVLILSSEFGEADAVCNLILSLVYYFYNLMPLSRGSSVIAYSVIVGALMASGKEVTGKIPKGKLVDFEAMTAPGSEAFSKIAKSWMNLKSISPSYKSLPSVSEAFPTLRSMIEVLNTDSSPRCLKKL
ncbi:tetratricopeptide repeat protein 13 isoform X2 [Panthera pardus]|uniref:Tetratricopeptide repeat protein 13 isoform X2 n=1 Tax=Panthera pardus TaxID=9691 RepID=A0A9V1E5R8_PANPR|nr:tetratricopeptide repeat protein 13 isoform X2 [Panthera pardus]XP_042763374.1 tetratricopeptide repeat protein 13 isoform X2 [Panthera leo]XP_042815694.1 tetratricopeptide repeat protein 13 isoform X2 [Panthera tigris]XP_060498776.1 tetratricopeptide repeat protein 13 isoform X2 [Panthera onca]